MQRPPSHENILDRVKGLEVANSRRKPTKSKHTTMKYTAEETAEGTEASADGEAPKEGDQTAAADDAKKTESDKDKKEVTPEKK